MPKVTVLNAEKKIFLYESTMAEEIGQVPDEHRALATDRLAALCGCYSMKITEEMLVQARQMMPNMVELEAGQFIVLIDEFVNVLSAEEREAVMHHEMEHILLGHTEDHGENGIILRDDFELAADQAAVRAVGAAPMASAIIKLLNRGHDVQRRLAFLTGNLGLIDAIEESRQVCLNHPLIQRRLAALQ